MKKIGFIFMVSLFSTIIISSCQQEKYANDPIKSRVIKYEEVGILHNQGLDYIFNYLLDNNITSRSTDISLNAFNVGWEQALEMFMQENNMVYFKDLNGISTRSGDAENLLNSKQQKYLDQLLGIFERKLSYEQILSAIDKVAKQIETDLTEEEARPLLCGVSVAYYTTDYWYKNHKTWFKELGGVSEYALNKNMRTRSDTESGDGFDWEDLGKADVAGAVGGAMGGAAAGAVAGAMTGGAAGAGAASGAVTGAISVGICNSAMNAVEQIWDMIFN